MDREKGVAGPVLGIVGSLLLAALAGCATAYPGLGSIHPGKTVVYRPVLHPEKPWQAAEKDLEKAMGDTRNMLGIGGENEKVARARILPGRITLDYGVRGKSYDIPFDRLAGREIAVEKNAIGALSIQLDEGVELYMFIDEARRVADGLLAAQQGAMEEWRKTTGEREARLAAFGPIAQQYRALAAKPPLPEELRRLIVQAEAMREEKEFAGAIAQYEKVVKAAPTAYPEGYYNLSLLSEQVGDFAGAIFYMKLYLMVRPDGPEARAAQDKVYKWEYLMQKR